MKGPGEDALRDGEPSAAEDRWAALMAQTQRGDRAAYALLLKQILPYLRSVASARARTREDVEDIVQDILLTLHAVRGTYDARRPFKPWLLAIARHRTADWLRRRVRIVQRERGFEDGDETFHAAATNGAIEQLTRRDLRRAIAGLSPGQRAALTFVKLEEMSLKEASQTSGLSVGALKVATHRAILTLRKVLTRA
jgi:RNA polymerase sigma factor (sigma-70 family)